MSNISEGAVSLTNETVEVQQHDFSDKETRVFKPKAGKTYRIHFPSEDVLLRRRHYNPVVTQGSRYFRCLDYQGYCPVCVAAANRVGEGKMRIKKASDIFGANILVYDTNDDGSLKEPHNAEVYFWAFGSDKFIMLRSIIKEWGSLKDIDLTVVCTDEQFQKVTITAGKKCYYMEEEELRKACDKKVEDDSYPLDKFLCKEVPLLELAKVFGLDVNTYIPQEILAQMSGQIAQDLAAAPSQPAQNTAQAPQQTTQQAPATNAQVTSQQAASTPPQPEASNFSDLENLGSLL